MPHPCIPRTLRTIAFAGLALAAAAATAQDYDSVRLLDLGNDPGRGRVGAALVVGHEYRGSDERRTRLFPLLDYQWKSGWFAGVSNGIGYAFENRRDLHWGLRMTADFGREEDSSPALRGLGDVDARPEFGAFFGTTLASVVPGLALTASVRAGSAGGSGLLADLGAGHGFTLAPALRLNVGVATTLANREHMQRYFGITAEQAARSGYARTDAGAGLRDVRAGATLLHAIDRRMALTATLGVSSLRGDAATSPITRKKTAATAVATFTYAF